MYSRRVDTNGGMYSQRNDVFGARKDTLDSFRTKSDFNSQRRSRNGGGP